LLALIRALPDKLKLLSACDDPEVVAAFGARPHPAGMFVVTEAEAAAGSLAGRAWRGALVARGGPQLRASNSDYLIESGKDDTNWAQLEKALRMCRVHRATLVISKLDRLSRDAAWLQSCGRVRIRLSTIRPNPAATRSSPSRSAAVEAVSAMARYSLAMRCRSSFVSSARGVWSADIGS
jgi:hypothetical protein